MSRTSLNMIRRLSYGVILLASVAARNASALQGGNPSDPNSCYSDCGDLAVPGVQNCFCDSLCESKGDCCVDKHEWCAPSTAKPVCSMVDQYQSSSNSLVCGTDLGYSFVHNNRIEMLFGDTYEYNAKTDATCVDHGVDGRSAFPADYNDDSQGRLSGGVTRPPWVPGSAATTTTGTNLTCTARAGASTFNFDQKAATGSDFTFQQIRLNRLPDNLDIPMGLVNTPLTGFSDGFNAFAMFVAAPPDEAFPYQVNKHVYVARRRGEGSVTARTTYDTIADLGRFGAAGGSTKFLNVTSARVGLSDFNTPTGAAAGYLYVWGRPSFAISDGVDPSTNAVYLMRVPISAGGLSTWSSSYFSTIDTSGQATWTSGAPGNPVLSADFKNVNQMDIKWITELNKWVMVYGGDLADYFNPPTVTDQPRHGAIHMRTADYPWGPWSHPTPLLWREEMGRYYQCDAYNDTAPMGCDRKASPAPAYPPSDWEPGINGFTGTTLFQDAVCQVNHPKAAPTPNLNPISPFCPSLSQRGNLYAPNLLPTWTNSTNPAPGVAVSTTLYLTVSTWYPYDIVLAAADLLTPRVTYPLQMQLRQASTNKMVGGSGTTPTFSTTAGGTNGGSVAFRIDKDGGIGAQKMKVGDVVVLRHVSDSNKLLAVAGAALNYVTNVASPPSTAKWTLTSPTLPVGTLVLPGSTSVRLTSVSSPTLFIKSTSGQPALGSADSTADFRFSYFCQSGDTCTR